MFCLKMNPGSCDEKFRLNRRGYSIQRVVSLGVLVTLLTASVRCQVQCCLLFPRLTFFEQRVFVLCIKVWFDVHDRLPSLTRFDVPDYPEDPKTDEEKDIKAKYGKVSRSG